MAKKKVAEIENSAKITTFGTCDMPKRCKENPLPTFEGDNKTPVLRPAMHMGRMLALQQVDGIDSTLSSRLLKAQFDESHGVADPLSDIHTDPLEFRDKLMREGYDKVFTDQPNTTE